MKISDTVLQVLSRAQVDGQVLYLPGQLERKLYEQTNKVLEAAGGKWNRKAGGHLFTRDATERVDQMILTGEVEIPKDEFNYFPTPDAVAARMLTLAGKLHGLRVLEPSAGQGAIAMPAYVLGAAVDAIELMDANYEALKRLPGLQVQQADFLTVDPLPIYDRVLMNPPFMKQADIKHVLHALKFLKPRGLLVAVMSAGVAFRDNALTRDFRELIRQRGGDLEALPDGAFKESGTMVRTVIVTIPGAGA